MLLGKGALKICSKFTGEQPHRSAISIKLLCNFVEVTLWHGCSPANLLHIFRIPLLENTSGWLLLSGQYSHVIPSENIRKVCISMLMGYKMGVLAIYGLNKENIKFVLVEFLHKICQKHFFFLEQFSIGVLIKRCSENMQQIYRRATMPKCDFKYTQQII